MAFGECLEAAVTWCICDLAGNAGSPCWGFFFEIEQSEFEKALVLIEEELAEMVVCGGDVE
jgi:hypothetical protein